MGRVLRLAAVAGLAAAGSALGQIGPAHASPTHVAIVIAGDKSACVAWHSGITGDDVLHAVAQVTYRRDGLIVQIDGKPASGTADDTHFWAYWHNTGGGWVFSDFGAGSYRPKAGTVEGWAYGNQAKPPLVSYASVCHDDTAAPAPTPTSKPASTHAASSSSRAPAPVAPPPGPPGPVASSHASVSASPSAPPLGRHRPSRSPAKTSAMAARPSAVDSSAPSTTPPTGPPNKHHASSVLPAAGTAAGIVAAAAIGGVAFWRMRRQDGN